MILNINNIKKTYAETTAIDINNYSVNEGEIVGIIGNNGAGKTTLFRLILDLIKPDTGKIYIENICTSESEEWKHDTGAFIDDGFLIDFLTPDEYFNFICKINSVSQNECNERLNVFKHISNGEIIGTNKLIRNLSAGNKQKVGIIGAMLHKPKLLILDEPFNFLDPSSQLTMKKILESYNKETGATILISSHNLQQIFNLCSRVTLLEHGKIIKDGFKNDVDLLNEIENYFIHQS